MTVIRISQSGSVRTAIVVAAMLAGAATLSAHDFWLVPNAFVIAPGGALEVRGQTSSRFPTSEAAVGLDRIASARILGSAQEAPLRGLSASGKSLLVQERPRTAGQKIIAVALKPRSVRESAEGFRRYLVLEGAPEALARYEREGKLPTDSITRRYTKYAKTLVEVGREGPRAFDRAAGHTLEFIPVQDPTALRAGDAFAVRLLYRGQPLAGARIHASGVPMEPGMSLEAASAQAVDTTAETDAQGVARVRIESGGLWNVRTIHIVPADRGTSADWDTHWASLVFGVGPAVMGPGRPAATSSRVLGAPVRGRVEGDSAAVVNTIDRFYRALATGDTATVMELLRADAVILESGGAETRAEYRSHHLPGDMAFAQAVPRKRSDIRVRVQGDVAWATSTGTVQGEFRGRAINSQTAELMVLRRTQDGWKIAAVHWSSRNRRAP